MLCRLFLIRKWILPRAVSCSAMWGLFLLEYPTHLNISDFLSEDKPSRLLCYHHKEQHKDTKKLFTQSSWHVWILQQFDRNIIYPKHPLVFPSLKEVEVIERLHPVLRNNAGQNNLPVFFQSVFSTWRKSVWSSNKGGLYLFTGRISQTFAPLNNFWFPALLSGAWESL